MIAAADFFTTEAWTARGLTTYVLFLVRHARRAVHIAGITPNPDDAFMVQVARTLTASDDGFLRDKHYMIVDLDSKFTDQFKRIGWGAERRLGNLETEREPAQGLREPVHDLRRELITHLIHRM